MDEKQIVKQVVDAIKGHPYVTTGLMIGASVFGYFKFLQYAVYTGTMKANKRTVEYLSWINNQIIY